MQKVADIINNYLGKNLSPSQYHLSLKDDFCLDSLDIAELIVKLEETLKIEFDGEKMPPLNTVSDLISHTLSLTNLPGEN